MSEKPRVNYQVTSKFNQDFKNPGNLQAHSQSHINSHLLLIPEKKRLKNLRSHGSLRRKSASKKATDISLILEN